MKNVTELFDRYKKGILEDDRIDEMNNLLIEAYFSESEQLGPEEKAYTEDLVFERFAKHELEERMARQFREKIAADIDLNKKFYILKNLVHPAPAAQEKNKPVLSQLEETEEQEEEALKAVLEEVIAKAHAEEESQDSPAWIDTFIESMKAFFQMLIAPFFIIQPQADRQLAPVYVLRPQLKVAMAFASLTGLALVVWFSVSRKPEFLTAETTVNDTVIEQQIIVNDSGNIEKTPEIIRLKDPGSLLEEHYAKNDQQQPAGEIRLNEVEMPQLAQQNEVDNSALEARNDELFASLYAPPGIEFLLDRGELSDAKEKLVLASQKYNGDDGPVDYNGCIEILQSLVDEKAFKTYDTLNLVYYFLGSSYLKTGIDENNPEKITMALEAFNRISPEFKEYLTVRWYTALAHLKLGNTAESFRLSDSLVRVDYLRMGDVELLRDSLYRQIP
ncbi:MAG: hypothetical protein RBS55_11315 [Bacteroidales bacterium]|jgi:hypothetical protein|nr:hypothetical protein [Bacteroidales bacterium]